jgi:DNA-binding XRE family transcriptional regulator
MSIHFCPLPQETQLKIGIVMKQSNTDNNLSAIDLQIGALLRKARESKGLTTTELGSSFGISGHQFEKYETGSNRLPAALLFEISKHLGVPIAQFFE